MAGKKVSKEHKARGHSNSALSRIYGGGDTCSADGMRFYVPINVLAADYSPLLQGRGLTLLAHTSDHYLRFYQQAIPCKLREATFNLVGLIEHDTELDPKTCFTDTHGYTEVVMATAAMPGFELAPRIRDIKDQTLYKIDRHQRYPILTGTIRPQLIKQSWVKHLTICHDFSVSAKRANSVDVNSRIGFTPSAAWPSFITQSWPGI